jgi:hypothetical protein
MGLAAYLRRPMSPPSAGVAEAIARGPIDPGDALMPAGMDRLLDPRELRTETGWCTLADGIAYAAVRTEMPGVTAEMVDWWFDWYPRDSIRYRLWFPGAHESISIEPAPVADAKPCWGTIHRAVEDIGLGSQRQRIDFQRPTQLGFSTDALDDPRIATIVAGLVSDDSLHVQHTLMAHVFLNSPRGVTLRSRFWIGAVLRSDLRALIPPRAAHALASHCAAEYANLASLLPGLHRRYAQSRFSQSPAGVHDAVTADKHTTGGSRT